MVFQKPVALIVLRVVEEAKPGLRQRRGSPREVSSIAPEVRHPRPRIAGIRRRTSWAGHRRGCRSVRTAGLVSPKLQRSVIVARRVPALAGHVHLAEHVDALCVARYLPPIARRARMRERSASGVSPSRCAARSPAAMNRSTSCLLCATLTARTTPG